MKTIPRLLDTLWIYAIFWSGHGPYATTVRGLPNVGADRRSAAPGWRWRFTLP